MLIVGAGKTGIDIAGHLLAAGARVRVSMRTPPNIFPRQWGPIPLEPLGIRRRVPAGQDCGRVRLPAAACVSGNLEAYGIPRAPEGYESKFRRTMVGAAVDDGFIDALKAGRTSVTAPIESFDGRSVVLSDQTRLTPDVVICATGLSAWP